MDYRLVLSDIDGTLLDDDYRLLPSTEKTVRELVASGVLFATASARTVPYTLTALNGLKDTCCANAYVTGAYVEASNGDVLIDKPIFKQETGLLVEQLNKVQASFCCVSKTRTVANLRHPQVEGNFVTFSGGYTDLSSLGVSEFETYFILAFGKNLDPVVEAANQIPDLDAHFVGSVSSDGMQALDLQKKGANKESALASIIEYFDIDVSQAIAIGDSIINDGPMIEVAGWGVAVKNADQEILDKADQTTAKDNNHDGVGAFLRSFFSL